MNDTTAMKTHSNIIKELRSSVVFVGDVNKPIAIATAKAITKTFKMMFLRLWSLIILKTRPIMIDIQYNPAVNANKNGLSLANNEIMPKATLKAIITIAAIKLTFVRSLRNLTIAIKPKAKKMNIKYKGALSYVAFITSTMIKAEKVKTVTAKTVLNKVKTSLKNGQSAIDFLFFAGALDFLAINPPHSLLNILGIGCINNMIKDTDCTYIECATLNRNSYCMLTSR